MSRPYALMADLHLHRWSAFNDSTEDGVGTRLQGLLGEIMRCAEELKERGGEFILIAGDVFHVRGSVAPTVLNATIETLEMCHRAFGTKFFILPGNHDLEGKNTTRLGSAVTALAKPWAEVLDSTQIVLGDVLMIPWFESTTDLKAEIDRQCSKVGIDRSHMDLILHAPIDGVIEGLPLHGLNPEELACYGFKRVFAGHYHNHKVFPGCVYSIGALSHHTWSDIGTRAGYLIVDDDTVDYRASHLPRFLDLGEMAAVENPDELPLMVDGNFVRVKVEAVKSADVEAARAELMSMGARAVLVQPLPKAPPRREGEGRASAIASGASLEVSVFGFIKSMKGIPEASLEAVSKAAMDVLAASGETA